MIEEGAEYCSNCGTKLIFPEDEFVEENIPGDKITEGDMAQDENGEDSLQEEESASEEGEEEISLELNESEVSSDWEEVEDEIEAPSESQPVEKSASDKPKKRRRAPLGVDRFGPIPPSSKSWEDEDDVIVDEDIDHPEGTEEAEEPLSLEEEVEEAEEPLSQEEEVEEAEEPLSQEEEVEEAEEPLSLEEEVEGIEEVVAEKSDSDEEDAELFPEEPSISPDPTTGEISDSKEIESIEQEEKDDAEEGDFHTEDLENMVDPAEKEKEEIERFLDSLKKERQMRREASKEITEDLPPWAENMKTASSEEGEGEIELDESELGSQGEEEQKFELPGDEDTTTKDEYFDAEAEEEPSLQETLVDVPFEEEIPAQPSLFRTDEEGTLFGGFTERRTRGAGISLKLASRVFDFLFISILWILSIWGVSYIIKIPIFDIVSGSIIPLLGFFGILLLIYFFLFYFFLGETLGDYIFSRGK